MREFTKRQFRLLLFAYAALIVAGIFVALPQRTSLTQTDVAVAKSSYGLQGLSDHQFAVFMVCFISAVFLAWLIGLVSLFLLWRPGVYIFLAGVCGLLIVEYFRHLTPTGGWLFYGAVEVLLEFAIVALVLFGRAKHLFQRQRDVQI